MTWDQLWYTVCGLLALAGARLLDRWLPPRAAGGTTVVVAAPPDDESSGQHARPEEE